MAGTIDRGTAPAPTSAPLGPVQHDGLAIASLICAFFIPPLGIVFGHVSRHLAKQAHRAKSGIALAGLILGYIFTAIGLIVAIAVGASVNTATSLSPSSASSAPASPAKPAQPATASGYLSAHGYTVVQHFSRAEWLAKLVPGTAYAQYVAAGSDVAAYGLKGSNVEFAIKVSDPAAAASVAPSVMTLDGTYLVSSMAMPTTSPSASNPAPAAPASQPAAAAPAGPTVSQQQALDAAQSYLSMGSGFSRAGLIAQLTSKYGNGFSVADATWAVDHSGADWNAQAVMAAKGYMQMGGFSRASLIAQLTSPYGNQFTYAQAAYAASQVGL